MLLLGTFVQLASPSGMKLAPTAWEVDTKSDVPPIAGTPLSQTERKVLEDADRCLAAMAPGERFVDRFWGGTMLAAGDGARSHLTLGPHANNRVGNAQGGVILAHAAATAAAAVPRHPVLESVSAWFISPGIGTRLRAKSETLQHGRSLAVGAHASVRSRSQARAGNRHQSRCGQARGLTSPRDLMPHGACRPDLCCRALLAAFGP